MTTPAAGWFPDPQATPATSSTLRWWDGTQWTEHLAPGSAPAPTGPTTPDGVAVAPWGRRLGAYVIDALIVGTAGSIMQIPLYFSLFDTIERFEDQVDPVTGQVPDAAFGDFFGDLVQVWLISIAISLVLNFLYHAVCLRWWSTTPGKRALGLRVRRWDTEGPLGWGPAVKRAGSQFVLFGLLSVLLVQLLDGLWPLWDKRRQALHDKLAGTAVVDLTPGDAR